MLGAFGALRVRAKVRSVTCHPTDSESAFPRVAHCVKVALQYGQCVVWVRLLAPRDAGDDPFTVSHRVQADAV